MTNVLYQHGTLGTLMAGLLEGTATINELLEHGNLGIATLTGSDGEVIFLDGKAYHANEHKEFIELKAMRKYRMHRLLILKRVRHFHCNNYHKMMYSHKLKMKC